MRSVEENTATDTATGRFVGDPVVAIDDQGDTLTYSLSGSHATLFEIDPRSGEIETKAVLDHESRSSYSVTVTARDPSDEYDTIQVTMSVTNVEEDGAVTFSSEFPTVGQKLTATLTDPDGGISNVSWEWHRSTSRLGDGLSSTVPNRVRTGPPTTTWITICGPAPATPTATSR